MKLSKSILLFFGVFPCLAGIAEAIPSRAEKPNILFILVDDLGKEWIRSYGAEGIETPNVDYLAKTGLKFENFYSTPQCTPSRVSLFTGQYPFRHGWVNHWDVPRWGGGVHFDWNKNPGIAGLMQSAGYQTAAAGKWQVNDFRVQPKAMEHHGFSDWCMWTGYETGNKPSANRYWDPYIHTKQGSRTYKGEFGEDIFSSFLIDFMKKHRDEPMFLYYAMCLTHVPFTNTPLEPHVTEKYDCHKAMVRYTDLIVGKLIKALDDLGLRENTIIMFTTDNGTTGEITGTLEGRQVQGGKQKTTENGICEPFVVNCPKLVPKGRVTTALGDLTDILPTCAQLAGVPLPTKYIFDGVSLANVILGKAGDSSREWIMAMGGGNNAALSEKGMENQYRFRDRVIRNKQFKLFVSTERKPDKLFSLKEDPEEENNLLFSNDPQIKIEYEKLLKVVSTFPQQDADPHYDPLPGQPWDVGVTVKSEQWKK